MLAAVGSAQDAEGSRALDSRWLDGQCQLNFVTDRNATDTALWDLRLESPRDLHRTTVDGRDYQSTALVELYGWHVVIRRDEPEPLTVRRACCSLGRCEQGRTNPLAFCKAIEGHHLQLVPVDVKREEPHRHVITDGQEPRQAVGVVQATTGDDDCGAPVFLEQVADPLTVRCAKLTNHEAHWS